MRLGAIRAAAFERDDPVVAAAGDPDGVAQDGDVGREPRDPHRRHVAAVVAQDEHERRGRDQQHDQHQHRGRDQRA